MEERILKFIAALRIAGVRISVAESADAFNAVDILGVKDREGFRLSLQATLVKESRDLAVFEELFLLFFGSDESPPLMNLDQDLSPNERELLAQALQGFNERLRQMLEKLIKGEQLNQEELARLSKLVGLNQADDLRYREWMAERMKRALLFPELRQALQDLTELLNQLGMNRQRIDQLQKLLQANQQALGEQLRQFAGQRIADNLSQRPPDDPLDALMDRPLGSLSDRELELLRKEVQRLAAALRTRVALRQKRARNGQLDAKATIRANLKHGNVPIALKHRERTLKPKLVVICDVSTSMRSCSELMLSLLYELQDIISKTYAFAFIDHLVYISPAFQGRQARAAVHGILEQMPTGYYNTDLGHSLENFVKDYLGTIDSRTTFIIVGDGRNNYNNPRLDLFNQIARRNRRTIWLTTESPVLWGTGDSDMLKYAPACDLVLQASTLAELTAAVDKLLVQS